MRAWGFSSIKLIPTKYDPESFSVESKWGFVSQTPLSYSNPAFQDKGCFLQNRDA